MEVIKRDGTKERVSFDKITTRLEKLCTGLDPKWVDPVKIAQKTIEGLYSGIKTEEIDFLSADICATLIPTHPDFNKLAARVLVSNLHKKTSNSYIETVEKLYTNTDVHGEPNPLVSEELYNIVQNHSDEIQEMLNYDRDYDINFFGFKTLEKAYLIRQKPKKDYDMRKLRAERNEKVDETNIDRIKGHVVERQQHLIMRVALGIHASNMERVKETYDLMSQGYFTHATPTLFNAGTRQPQLSSCFLLGTQDDMTGIYKTITSCAEISKNAGGLGLHISNIRAKNSEIRGTNGVSNGIVPMIQVYNATARYVDQGGGKRKGSIAVYLEPHHADIFEFLVLRFNKPPWENRAMDMFLSLWISNLFMERVENDKMWSLMCPDECPGLSDVYGEEYKELYEKYEREGRYVKRIKARKLWDKILEAQIETGTPYMAYKDHANHKTNQQNIGTIKSSNLCCEIFEYSDHKEYAVCNLASIALPKFIVKKEDGTLTYDLDKLCYVSEVVSRNLNKIIDVNYYPVPETRTSNMRHRPIGIGVQGLADVYNIMELPFESPEAQLLNKKIFETIYFGAWTASNKTAMVDGPYPTYNLNGGCPMSKGQFQFNMWGLGDEDLVTYNKWDWKGLRQNIKEHGVRNSLVTAVMPTASTSQILGNNECIEPYNSNLYVRKTLAGEYAVMNENLVRKLSELDLWSERMRHTILFRNGSIQEIEQIPDYVKAVYKTSYEVKQSAIINQAVGRGPFIDQSQSLNIFSNVPNNKMLSSVHFYGWKQGLKTGMYYLRSKPAVDAKKFGLDPELVYYTKEEEEKRQKDMIDEEEDEEDSEVDSEVEEEEESDEEESEDEGDVDAEEVVDKVLEDDEASDVEKQGIVDRIKEALIDEEDCDDEDKVLENEENKENNSNDVVDYANGIDENNDTSAPVCKFVPGSRNYSECDFCSG